MESTIYQIDAFTDRPFSGNPAAVCPLETWLEDPAMQNIAAENNLSETAFFVKKSDHFELRWFTPVVEVDLCGHATLASTFVIMNYMEPSTTELTFRTKSGELTVKKAGDLFVMDFPSQPPVPCDTPGNLVAGLDIQPREVLKSEDYLVVLEGEDDVKNTAPDFERLKCLDLRGIIVTAPGRNVDFVSRFFGPSVGINEDPVTGSSHCTLIPYWSKRLGKKKLHALQVSERGGELFCEMQGDRVLIAGKCALYMKGTISL
ncbi:MAG: PhzF family phenazine biosynthesis protein [Deltaproteobacteria bacterium]|nr:PhzF family phenazine biosynthesis protein [Deltaproteobacteria bacterium]MBN2844459.1 PhzF family phenazine biosynthesis protein [Deltaproteobacteria bacterium]